mmetsp:Transcript_36587/g.117980  ORF Transcript_36587/g.117980 Transcript_36587/m.117980 type:complete len:306 (+) Transcript_36587:1977-2894(+)
MPLDPEGSEAQGGARESRRRARAAAGDGRDGLRQRAADSDGADARLGLHAARRAPPARGAARRGRGGLRRLGERPLLDGAPDRLLLAPVAGVWRPGPARRAVRGDGQGGALHRRAREGAARGHLPVGRRHLHLAVVPLRADARDQLAPVLRLAAQVLCDRLPDGEARRHGGRLQQGVLPRALLVPRGAHVLLGAQRHRAHVLCDGRQRRGPAVGGRRRGAGGDGAGADGAGGRDRVVRGRHQGVSRLAELLPAGPCGRDGVLRQGGAHAADARAVRGDLRQARRRLQAHQRRDRGASGRDLPAHL